MDIIRQPDVIKSVEEKIKEEELRKEIITKYVAPEDIAAITDWCKRKNSCISFREAGTATIRCLQLGAGAKPHTILDKTIKNPEEKDAVRKFLDMFPADLRSNIEGLVGHWTDNNVIDGIYLTANGIEHFRKESLKDDFQMDQKNDMPYLKIVANTPEKLKNQYEKLVEENENENPYNFMRLFYTGDYDTHDLLQCRKPVVSADSDKPGTVSGGDACLLFSLQTDLYNNRINYINRSGAACQEKEIGALETADEKTKADFEIYRHVQHGPQCNYIAQMERDNQVIKDAIQNHNYDTENVDKINLISGLVAAMSYPLAYCDKGEWGILREAKDIVQLYEKNGIKVKPAWTDPKEIEKWKTEIRNCILICYLYQCHGNRDKSLDELAAAVQEKLSEAPKAIKEYVGGIDAIINFLKDDTTGPLKGGLEPGGNRFITNGAEKGKYSVKDESYGKLN